MENRYLYRGKRREDREWVEGFLFVVNDVPYILPYHNTGQPIHVDNLLKTAIEVLEDTVCQCTGYEGIYEKDIFQCEDERYVIEWCDYSLGWEAESIFSSETISLGEFLPKEIDVIGNVFDNPELLE